MLTSLSACGGEGQPNTSNTPMDDDAAAATAILEEAVARRETIQTSKTQIVWDEALIPGKTYTGTAYYVSNQGDDGNDGLSPETAWSTLDRVNQASLEYGDAVFLERGGVWRNTTVETKEGVTYSAYGGGRKAPDLRLSGERRRFGALVALVGGRKWGEDLALPSGYA